MIVTSAMRLERDIAWLAGRLAPVEPIVPHQVAERLGIPLDAWQTEALRSVARQVLLNVCRQGGKSTIAALLGLCEILSTPNALVLAISPGERQSKLLFRTLLRYYRALGKPVPAVVENKLSLELVNGSEVHALPGETNTIRGFSDVSLLLVDEASRVPDEMMGSIRPMLAVSGGRLVTMSTPAGQRGWWHTAWVDGGDDWERFEIPATSCPRISPGFLAAERRALPRIIYQAEYECAFVETEDQLFRYEDIQAALTPGLVAVRPFTEEDIHAA